MLEVRELRYFLEVALTGNITKAANHLHVTQPCLSRAIKDLEGKLGQRLLVRRSHSVELTPEGALFVERARAIIDLVGNTEREFQTLSQKIEGQVNLCAAETPAFRLLSAVIADIQAEHPGVRFNLESGNYEQTIVRLDQGIYDFGLVVEPFAQLEHFEVLTLPVHDSWRVILPAGHPLCRKKVITPDDLVEVPIIMSSQELNNGSAAGLRLWFGARYSQLQVVDTFNLLYNATLLVEQGIGVLPALGGIINVRGNPKLCERPMKPELTTQVYLIWGRHRTLPPPAQLFLERFKAQLEIMG